MKIAFHYLLPLCLCALVAGCHREAAPEPEAETSVAAPAPAPPAAPSAAPVSHDQAKAAPPTPNTAAHTPDLADPKVTKAGTGFNPPFPNRFDLFDAPKHAQSTVRRDDEHGETVELKGFINVDEPRVVLSIDGEIAPISEGGEKFGVKVIAIQPPNVVLQRGRNRWTATLE